MNKGFPITRRHFLKGTAGTLLALGMQKTSAQGSWAGRSRVIIIRNPEVLGADLKIRTPILAEMLDEGISLLTGEQPSLAAWRKLFQRSDVVGIKSNVWAPLPTPRELEEAIQKRLLEVGVSEGNLAVDDRGVRHHPVFKRATALINVRPLRTHHWSGVGTCLKNYIMFVPHPWQYHDQACSDLGKIWTFPEIKGKTRLNILVALTPQFFGRGPHSFDRRYLWPYGGLILGFDPVAVDSVGAELLRRKRVEFFGEDRELDAPPIHIYAADRKYRLGVSELSRIEIVRVGSREGILI